MHFTSPFVTEQGASLGRALGFCMLPMAEWDIGARANNTPSQTHISSHLLINQDHLRVFFSATLQA